RHACPAGGDGDCDIEQSLVRRLVVAREPGERSVRLLQREHLPTRVGMPSDGDEILPDDRTRCPLRGAVVSDGEGHRLVSGQPPPGGHDEVIARSHRGPDLAVEANIIDVEYV